MNITIKPALTFGLLAALLAQPLGADEIINFDGLPPTSFEVRVPSGYDGFGWGTFRYVSTADSIYAGSFPSTSNVAEVLESNSSFGLASGRPFTLVSLTYAAPSGAIAGFDSSGALIDEANLPSGRQFNFTVDFTNVSRILLVAGHSELGLDSIDVIINSSFSTTPGLDSNERGIAGSIDRADNGIGSNGLTQLTTALLNLPTSSVAGALDQLSPTKFASFASTTAVNNEVFATQDMDIYLQNLRDDSTGGFASGSGKLDSSGLVVNDPNVDPGLQMVHSRMLAWEDPVSTVTDVPGSILGGIDMKGITGSGGAAYCGSASSTTPWDVFLRGSVVLAQGFSQADVPHFDDNSESVVVGADYHFTPHLLAGVTASYAHTDATLDDFGSSATVDSYSPGVFVSWADGGGYVNFLGRYSYNSYTESRDISFLGQTASGGTDGNEGAVDLDGGYDFHAGPWTYGPVAGVQYTHLTVNGYTEDGSDAALTVNEDQSDSLRSRLGGSVRYSLNGCGVKFTPRLEATWQHEFLSQDRGLTSQFENFGGGSFTVRTPNASDDSALVDVGLDAQVNQSITVFGDYLVQAGQSDYFGQSVQAGVRVNF